MPLAACNICSLPVFYIEYPPYYYSENGTHKGFLLEQAEKIFRRAGLNPVFKSVPAKRILNDIQLNKGPLASIGWYKTEERARFAKFTRPIYVNKPVVLVCLKKNENVLLVPEEIAALAKSASVNLNILSRLSMKDIPLGSKR